MVNRIRAIHSIAAVLSSQQHDPLCRGCVAFSRSVEALRERLREAEADLSPVPADLSVLCARSHEMLGIISVQEKTVGQKKAGNCRMPEGVCFPKYAMALLEKPGV